MGILNWLFRSKNDDEEDHGVPVGGEISEEEEDAEDLSALSEAQLAARIAHMGRWIETLEAYHESRGWPVDTPNRLGDRAALQRLRDILASKREE